MPKKEEEEEDLGFGDIFGGYGDVDYNYQEEEEEDMALGNIFGGSGGKDYNYRIKEEDKNIEDKKCEDLKIKDKKIEIYDLNNKDHIIEIINTQDFIEGYWDVNEKTKIIKEKYNKAFQLLKDKNINDKASITILIIFFINKEHPELLDELLMIIKKAKEFIDKSTNTSYEEIITEIFSFQ